jgi:cytochrome c-type biogenesis protein CcmH
MMLWLILTVMTSAAAVWLSVPFIRRLDRPQAGGAGEVEVYRDQLQEIDRELRQGLIDGRDADIARIEVKRRVLTLDRPERPAMPRLALVERNFAVLGVTGVVLLGSVALYGVTEGQRAPLDISATTEQATRSERQPQNSVPPVEEMIQRLATRLVQNPNDLDGWRTLGWAYLNTGRFSEAGEVYAKAIELGPDIAELRGARVEALVRAADGIVTPDAKSAIEDALKLDRTDIRARFFMGLAKAQAGDRASALADWRTLLTDANSDEPWTADLKDRISELESGVDADAGAVATASEWAVAGSLASRTPAVSPSAPRDEMGPGRQDVPTAKAMPPADRSAMIRGMVDRLANRLEQSPRDADGWIKLIRARIVLGESDLARQALRRGLQAFGEDPPERDRIVAAAQQFGLKQ